MLSTLTKDHLVIYYPVDEGYRQLIKRLARHCGMSNSEIRRPENESKMLSAIKQNINMANLIILQPGEPSLDLDGLLALAVEQKPADKRVVVIVDSLHSLPTKDSKDIRLTYTDLCMKIMTWTNKTGSIFIGIAEQNRAAYAAKNENDRPNALASTAESRAFEFKADYVISLTKGDEAINTENTSNYVRWFIAKARDYRKFPDFVTLFDNKVTFHYPVSEEDAELIKINKELEKKKQADKKIADNRTWLHGVILHALESDPPLGLKKPVFTGVKTTAIYIVDLCKAYGITDVNKKIPSRASVMAELEHLLGAGSVDETFTVHPAIKGNHVEKPSSCSANVGWQKVDEAIATQIQKEKGQENE
jgi:hypothetical protein